MVAAMLRQDDRLLDWLQIVAEIRYNTELCEEYLHTKIFFGYEIMFTYNMKCSNMLH